jgi:hypothetical protein
MFPLFIFAALVAAVASDSAGSSSSSTTDTPPPPDVIKLSCDDALELIPVEFQDGVSNAILTGDNRAALEAFARHLDELAGVATGDMLRAAYQVLAHCVRARADGLPLSVSTEGKGSSFAAPASSVASPSPSTAMPLRWGSYSLEGM